MNGYRDILYRDYSAAFGAQKQFVPGIQHAQYDVTYTTLPSTRDAVIADLGCGRGEWLGWMASKGWSRLTGVDLAPSDLAVARETGPSCTWVESSVIPFLEAHASTFDLLHAKDIVEHFTKDEFIQFLTAARGALRPGGELWLLTFNAQSPLSSAIRYGDFTHEIGLTPASMAQCLRACGFTSIVVRGQHYCSASGSGRVRHFLGKLVFKAARLLLKIRHGGGAADGQVDLHCTQPDLFARAVKE